MSFSSKDKVPRYKSPYTRSSETSSITANKSSKRSPKRPRDDIFSAKESIRSSLEEHSAKLQEEIDLKEREQNLLRKSGSSKILSIEEHIRVLEKKKVELLDRIEQIALETKEFDNERATLARAISVKDQRISDLLTQAQRVSHEQAKNKRVETEDITFQYRTHESYVDMLGEREKLLDGFNTQIKKLENECQRSEEEIARLQGEIERRGPKIALMNRDNREVENKIQAHDQKLKTLKINEVELDSELKILLSQKAKLLGERDVMKAKMEEIKTDTHMALRQLLAAQKKMEIKLNSNIKAFACRVMGIVMKRYQLRHMAAVVKRIETYKFGKSSFLGGVAKLSGIVENVRRRYLQETLLDLHGKFLNYPKISQLNEEMLRIKTDRNLKFRTWVMWRQKAKLSYMKREHQINALSKMSRIINEYEKRAKYEFISIVQSYSLRNETRLMELHSLFMKKNIKECQRAFSKWLIFVQLTNQAQDRARCEASLTNIRFLSYFFNRLRDHAKRSRKAKYNLLRKNFEQWYSEYQTRRLDAGNEIKADEMIQLKERGMLNKTFLEWKTILLQSKSRKMWGNSKERTEEYQANVKNLEKFENADQKKVKKNCFRRMSMTLKQKMGHYLHLWNFNAKTQSRKIEIAINCINRVLDKSLRQNFKRWKIIAAYLTHQNAEREKERALYYTEQVENQLMEAGDWHGIHGVNKTAHHLFQLERIAQRHKRRIIFRFFRKFHDNATQINKKEKAYTRGFLKLHKLFLKSHRQFFTYTATEYLRDRKLLKLHNAFGERRVQLLKTNSLLAIKQNAEKMQAAKQTLRKYFKNKWKKALSKRFLSWAHKVNHLKHRDSKKTHEQLESMYRSRNVDLEKVVRTNQSSEVNALDYGKKVLAGKYTNIFNILINNIGTLKLTALRRWREHAKQLFYKRKASFFMEKWIVRFYCRHFFQNMVLHGDKFQLATGKDLLDSVLNQRKEFKMKIDEEKEKFEGLHLHQEAQIVELTSSRNELKISSKFIKNALAKKLHEDRNAKFLSEVFKAWTHTIKNEKKGFEILVQTASRKLLREVFETIYIRSHTLNKADLQKRLLYKLVSNMETAQKEISFKNWKRFAFLRRKESAQIKLAKTGKNLDIVKAYFDRIKESGVQKVTLGNQKKLLQKYFTLFVEGVSIVKSLKKGKDKLVEKFAGETKLSFFEHLFNALKYKKYTTNLVNNARRRQNFRISREVFSSWKDEVRRIKTFGRVILHYQKIFNARNSLYALHTLNDYKLAKRFATNQDKKFAVTTCVNFVNLLHTMTLKQSLSTLKQNIYERSIIRQRVKELFIRAQRSKTAPYLQKWRRKTRALVVVSASHNTGPLYEEKKQLNRQITFLENLADQEGYEKEDVEFFQAKEDVARFNLLQKGISRLMLNSNGMGVLTKALNSWKEFVVQRKRVKYYANLIGNYMRKSDIAMGFSVWRNAVIREKEAEEEFSKVELKRKLAEQKNQDFFLTNQIKEVDKIQTEMEMLVEKQQIELDIAKGLAVKNLCRVELIFQKRAFEVLKAHDHDIKSNWKVDKSEAAGDTILKMQREIKYLEAEYKGLGRENEMLRATSLQGLDIANAIKEISKERDRLSKELESKDMTVKRLVNENQNLSIRLATAQREAEELIRYAKEFLQPMSAKISARSNESNESPNNKNTVRSSNVLSKK